MEGNSLTTGGNQDIITGLEEQNQKLVKQITEMVKEKQEIIDERDKIVTEKEKKIVELKETNSKLLDPQKIVTAHELNEKSISWNPQLLEERILFIRKLGYNGNTEWHADGVEIFLDDDTDFKIYIQESLLIKSLPADEFPNLIEYLCPKSFDWLHLIDLTISFDDYKNLVAKGNIAILDIHQVTVTKEVGTVITADQLLKEVPDLSSFAYTFNNDESMEGLAEKFAQLPLFSKLRSINLYNIQEGFDLKTFGQVIQKYAIEHFSCLLEFHVFKETFAKMEQIKEEILSTLPSSLHLKIMNNERVKDIIVTVSKMKPQDQENDSQISEHQIAELQTTNSKLPDLHDVLTVYEYQKSKFDPWIKRQNRTLLTFRMDYIEEKWLADGKTKVDFDYANFKIFVQDSLVLNALPGPKFTSLLERLHTNSFTQLCLTDLTMSFVDYKNLVEKGKICKVGIHRVTVTNENGTALSVDQLMKEVPNIHFFNYTFHNDEKMDGIAQKLVELPRFPNLQTFQLLNIPEGFDSEVFGQFVKKNAIKDKVLRFKKEMDSNLGGYFVDNSQIFF